MRRDFELHDEFRFESLNFWNRIIISRLRLVVPKDVYKRME